MDARTDIAIRTEGLAKTYRSGGRVVRALTGVDLRVARGTVLGLLGANGSGKTTLLRILTTLAAPSAGRAWVDGVDVMADGRGVRERIGVIGQSTSLDDRLSGEENLRLFGGLHGLDRATARERARTLLEKYHLQQAAARPVGTYSGGMRRRLDIVSGLVRRPPVLFLDEPTTGLDPHSRAEIWATVRALADGGTTVFLTTQYLDEADRLADRIAVLEAGRLIAEGSPGGLKARIGRRLSVTLARPDDLERARQVLGRVGVEVTEDAARAPSGAMTLAGRLAPDAMHRRLPELLDVLTRAGVEAADIGVHDPTLDEAYLALTATVIQEKK